MVSSYYYFDESQIYRIDHYLGKETVQNLMAIRFGNMLFEPLWNSQYIDHIQFTVAETVGVAGREEYYDRAGAMRDMVQNHMMQLLCLIAMEPPAKFDPDAVRDEKLKVIRALDALAPNDVVRENMLVGESNWEGEGPLIGKIHALKVSELPDGSADDDSVEAFLADFPTVDVPEEDLPEIEEEDLVA